MREYKVMASSLSATYSAGKWCADSPEEACEMARENYANSGLGRACRDVGAFHFYTVSRFPHETAQET